ncbi:MAG: sulfatase [Mangrovibacterium sp.]
MRRLFSFIMLAVVLASCASEAKQDKRPNIVFIFSDDHAYQAISAYGSILKDYAPTPNIDKLANEGMRFDRCLVTNSICGPSRATIISGKYGHKSGFVSNEDGIKFDGSQLTFPKVLQANGYQTGIVGKWHLGSDPTGFDSWEILPAQGDYYNPDFLTEEGKHNEKGYVTEIITQKAIKWMDEAKAKEKPFMLMVHHKAPHRNWQPGPNELTLYKDVVFPEPDNLFDDYSNRGRAAKEQDMSLDKTMRMAEDMKIYGEKRDGSMTRMSPEQLAAWNEVYDPIIADFKAKNPQGKELISWKYQRYLQDYLACIAAVDKSVGEIEDYLTQTGLDDNTIVIYSSDQGFYLGEHGWFDKRFMYEESLRTPLLVRWKGVTKAQSVNKDLVSNLDFAPTFLEMAGADIPEEYQGRSLVPVLKGETPEDWRTGHYYHYYEYPSWHLVKRHYGIATERYKLIHFYYDIDEWELYDLQKDPNEMNNVYDDAAYAEVKKELHSELEKLREQYEDTDELTQQYLDKSLQKLHHMK